MENAEKKFSWTNTGDTKQPPNIQEMIRIDPQSVPQRYVRRDEEDDKVCLGSEEVPFINMASLSAGDEAERQKLHSACKDWGYFQLINHGIEERVLQNIMAAQDSFYSLPLSEKLKFAKGKNEFQGYGQGYVFDDEQKIDWNDAMFLVTAPTEYRSMKFWPTQVPNFLNAVDEYSREIEGLSFQMLANLSLLMGMERDALKDLHLMVSQAIGMNYYPACARPDLVYGTSPHRDASSITFLLQDDNLTGLQIKHNGVWTPVKPVPNALVVGIGDALEAWSNGIYKSIDHRSVTNEKRARKSVATFVMPQEDAIIRPVETLVDDSHPRMYKNTGYGDYIRYILSQKKLDGKANIEFMKL